MKYLTGFFSALLFSGNLFAASLCDSSCDLSITFPDGGSIEAVEALTITFGDGGSISNGVVTTGYSVGDTLSFAAEEAIIFQVNGSFELGIGGNIDYSNIVVISNGAMNLAAVEGDEKVLIQNMTLLGNAALTISSDFEVVEDGSIHFFNGPVTVTKKLSFTNYGSFGGLSDYASVILSIEDEAYDITDSVLVQADSQISMISVVAVIEPAPVVSDVSDTSVGAASGGLFDILSLMLISILLVSTRYHRFSV